MPRQARIDAPSALHHIIIRGIDRKRIFDDDKDREDFPERLSCLLEETMTPCYAWAIMPNHRHLLLRTGTVPVASLMRRLLTGYAVRSNRRHHRHGHLFKNRYKSILCEVRYLMQLLAYVHLNPRRAGLVQDVSALGGIPFRRAQCVDGEDVSTLAGYRICPGALWKEPQRGEEGSGKICDAIGVEGGRCSSLTGGGLIRSSGGWRAFKEAFRYGVRLVTDERILGGNEFVEETLK